MKINVDTTECAAMQVFDCLNSYYQSLSPTFVSEHTITFNQYSPDNNINILLTEMPDQVVDYTLYDLILFCNGLESYTIGTNTIRDNLDLPNAFLLAQSYVRDDHPLKSKIIWAPASVMFPHSRSMSFIFLYPQSYYFAQFKHLTRNKNIALINGENRSWRHYLIEQVREQVPNLHVVSNLSDRIHETAYAYFESEEDLKFREFVEDRYKDQIDRSVKTSYYNSTVPIGITGEYGFALPGYFALPEYFEYRCIVWPESSWANDDLTITEKIIKCLMYGAVPWPVGGSNVNAQYNQLGFFTAWNLLPEQLQLYDSIKDHQLRYQKLTEAIAWSNSHPEIFSGEKYESIIRQNFENIIKFTPALSAMEKLDKIINDFSR